MELTLRRRGSYIYRCNICGWQSAWEPVGAIGPSSNHQCYGGGYRSMKTIAVRHWLEWKP